MVCSLAGRGLVFALVTGAVWAQTADGNGPFHRRHPATQAREGAKQDKAANARRDFAERMMKAIRTLGHAGTMRYDAKRFAIVLGKDVVAFLANHYRDMQGLPEPTRIDETRFLLARARTIVDREVIPDDFRKARSRLLPRIRSASFVTLVNLRRRAAGREPLPVLAERYAEGLTVEPCWDGERSIISIGTARLRTWGKQRAEVLKIARANFARANEKCFAQLRAGVYRSPVGDHHDASRLLMVEQIRKLEWRGRPVAFLPDPDTLLLADDADPDALQFAAARALTAWKKSSRRITGFAYRLVDGAWQRMWPLPAQAPAAVHELATRTLSMDFHDQKTALDQIHERSGEDIFVASCLMIQRGGRLRSLSSWARGVRTLLPQTELVALFDSDLPKGKQILGLFPWERVVKVMGAKMKDAKLVPPRFEVNSFPTPAQLEKLRAN